MMRMKTRIVAVLLGVVLVGCPQEKPPPGVPPSHPTNIVAPPTASSDAGATTAKKDPPNPKSLVVNGCFSCHLEDMVAQQRLTQAQWKKVVDKMVKWGAPLEANEADIVTTYLASMYGPDAGAYEPAKLEAARAVEEIAKTAEPSGAPVGNADRGHEIYATKCGDCHAQNARGLLGVALADKPIIERPADFMKVLDQGRGKMPPTPLSPAEAADVRAHLRSLRNPPH